jgi:methylmalonyl-CoA mutase C-terminal domain/subunit
VLLTGGGIISKDDMAELQKMGSGRLFGPGTRTQEIVDYIRGWAEEHRRAPTA